MELKSYQCPLRLLSTMSDTCFNKKMAPDDVPKDGCHPDEVQALKDNYHKRQAQMNVGMIFPVNQQGKYNHVSCSESVLQEQQKGKSVYLVFSVIPLAPSHFGILFNRLSKRQCQKTCLGFSLRVVALMGRTRMSFELLRHPHHFWSTRHFPKDFGYLSNGCFGHWQRCSQLHLWKSYFMA